MNEAGAPGARPGAPRREVLWFDLPSGGAECERAWLAHAPATHVERLGERVDGPVPSGARPLAAFVRRRTHDWPTSVVAEADRPRWVASVGLGSHFTAQAGRFTRDRGDVRQLVITWDSDAAPAGDGFGTTAQAWRAARAADLVVCPTEAIRTRLVGAEFDPDRVCVVRPGVDVARFGPAEAPVVEPVVVFADPLTRSHGIEMVLAAWHRVRAAVPAARLRVMSDGPLRPVVQRAAAAGIGVEHQVARDSDTLAAQLRACLLYVAAPRPGASRAAASRLRLLQAQAGGLPVVTTRAGGDQAFVADPPNDLVTQDMGHLAERLEWWLTHPAHAAQAGAYNRKRMLRDHDADEQGLALGAALSRAEASAPRGATCDQDERARDEAPAQR